MTRIHDINTALRSLDAADHHVVPTNARARTDLQRILATDPPATPFRRPWSPSANRVGRARSAARTTRRVALIGGMLAAVTAGLVMLPSLTGGDQAFASWTSTPHGMSAQERADAAASCRKKGDDGAGANYADELSRVRPVITERRGVWTTVVLAGKDGFSAMCITDDSTHLFGKDMIGSVGKPTDYAAPRPRDLAATDLGVGTMNAGDLSLAAGTAGSDIVGVAHHSRSHGDVAATVSRGHFAFWRPGDELKDASSNGAEVEVTYRDGRTGTSRLTLWSAHTGSTWTTSAVRVPINRSARSAIVYR